MLFKESGTAWNKGDAASCLLYTRSLDYPDRRHCVIFYIKEWPGSGYIPHRRN